jgi:sarcosine oxidase subunit beta
MTSPDVVLIGGGIVGLSCAYYLARAGVKVHLVEKGALGTGASKAGMMHVVTWEEPEIHLRLARLSRQLYVELSQELETDLEFRESGSIAIVEKPAGMTGMGEMIQRLQAWGLRCRMLSAQEILELEPNLSPDVAGGAFFEEDARVNPLYATLALAQAARRMGAVVEPDAEVTAIELTPDKSRVTAVVTRRGRIPTSAAVITAGAWSAQIGKMAGIEIPITPRRGTLVVTSPVPEGIIRCKIVLAAGYMDAVRSGANPGIAVAANIQQAQNGNLVLGSSRQFVGFDPVVDPAVISNMLNRCMRFFPALADLSAIRTWTGFRPYTPDLLPIISPVEEINGLYIASGHEGIGITEGPATGKLISQLVTGAEPEVDLQQLSYARFAADRATPGGKQ